MKAGGNGDTGVVQPRESHKVPAELVTQVLAKIRKAFYGEREEKRFWWEREILIRAITFPAAFLSRRAGDGVMVSWERYEQILLGILRTLKEHGDLKGVRNFGRYFLTAVQRHMEHQWETYYVESKRITGKIDAAMKKAGEARPVGDSVVAELSRLHQAQKMVAPKGGRKRRDSGGNSGSQQELF